MKNLSYLIIFSLVVILMLLWLSVQEKKSSGLTNNSQSRQEEKSTLTVENNTQDELYPIIEWGSPVEGFQLSIASSKSEYSNGETIKVRFSLKNVTQRTFYLGLSHSVEESYPLFIYRDSNEKIGLTLRGEEFMKFSRIYGGSMGIYLKPNEICTTRSIIINELYDLKMPGIYFISTETAVPRLSKKGSSIVKSGTIKIVIRNK
ncbi:MAG: hypothetical protein HY774_28940 [Acidobacteria bacterium]|nr:hypothetical protein [Acidobacteriota bacterium]